MSSTFSAAEGRPIVAADTADDIGEIKGFVVDPGANRIESVHVTGRGRRAEVLPWSSIRSFGDDAIIAEQADAPTRVADDHEEQAVKGSVVLRGTRVLSTEGFELGTVDDVMFDPESGDITAVLTEGGRIEAARLRAIGSYALIAERT